MLQVLPALNAGGVERGTLEIGRALVAAGHKSMVLSGGGRMVERLTSEGSEHICLAVGKKSLLSLRLIPQVRRLLEQVDIVHVRSRMPAWIVYLAWRGMPASTRPRLVTTVHGLYSVNRYSEVMTKGEVIIAISGAVRDYIRENYPRANDTRVKLIYRGVDDKDFPRGYQPTSGWVDAFRQQFSIPRERLILSLPARITRWKGGESFIRLIAQLADSHNVHGLIVGSAEDRQKPFESELHQLAATLNIADRLTFTGHRDDVREVMAISDAVYNLSTHAEPFGRTMIEALSIGRPVIAWNYGGAAESVASLFPDGLVDVGDEAALASVTKKVLAGDATPPLPNTFLLSTMCAKTLALYEELAERNIVG